MSEHYWVHLGAGRYATTVLEVYLHDSVGMYNEQAYIASGTLNIALDQLRVAADYLVEASHNAGWGKIVAQV